MSQIFARYALWILLCIPLFVLGVGLCVDLLNDSLQELRGRKAKADAKKAKTQKRYDFESEYRRRYGSGE